MKEETLRKSDLILDAVGFAAERFLRARRRQDAMEEVLAALGEAISTSRLQVYRVHEDAHGSALCSLQHEWAAPGIEPQISNPIEQGFPMAEGGFSRWAQILGSGETLSGLREDFPVSEQQGMIDEGIRSVLVVPIFVDARWWGWIGLDECETDREWSQVETDALRATAGIIAAAIERERAGEARQQAEQRYETLVEQIPAVTYIEEFHLPYSTTIFMSPQIEAMLGFPRQEWIDDPSLWERQMEPEDRGHVTATTEVANRTLRPYVSEYRMRAKDGRVVWIRDQATLVRDADGVPKYWQGVMIDTTEQRESTRLLEATESRYRSLVEQIPAITYIEDADRSGRMLYVSPQIETILQRAPEEWLENPENWMNAVHPDDISTVTRAGDPDTSRDVVSMEYRMLAGDGREIWFRDDSVLVYDTSGRPLFWQGVMHDITERKRTGDLERALEVERETSQRLRDLDDMKNTFLTAVSHDLRTPLAAILGLAITLEREDIDLAAKESLDLTRRIASNARKLDRLVTDLLDLDRLSRGILEPQLHPTDVGALVRKVINECDFLTDHPVQVEADPVVLAVDGAKVERIVENLLANAVRHTPVGTHIWLKVREQDDGALIAVEDAGPGIDPELREAVFEPFRQGLESGHSPGVGIGLSLVARFTELHGGKAWVEDREGGGACFMVFLPGGPSGSTHFA